MILQKFEKKIKIHQDLLNPLRSLELEQSSEKEIREQERGLCYHSETIEQDGFLLCKMCGIRLEKKKERKSNLFCLHTKTIEMNGYLVCSKCNGKWRIKTDVRI